MRKIIIIGGGGHGRVLIDTILSIGDYEIEGIVDETLPDNQCIYGVRVLGNDMMLPHLFSMGVNNVCIAVGSVGDNSIRERLYYKVKEEGFVVPPILHPKAIVSERWVSISEGVQVMAGAVVQSGCIIGENTIVNTGAVVEHDRSIGKGVHICPGVILSGGCTIGDGSFVGAGTVIIHGITVGQHSLIGAGSVVVNNVADYSKIKGVPAR
ncbi:MAG: acetyltransferase [Nitrospirae bacterium]|nr:acetyltransferase [Nitrospirota bacterium]